MNSDEISPSERLKRLHDDEMLKARIKRLRLRELRGWMLTDAEMTRLRALEREDEEDRAEQRSGDWTR